MNEKRSVLRVSVRTSRVNAGRFGSVLEVSVCVIVVNPRGSEIISLLTYQAPNGNYYGPLNLGSITLKGEVGARAYVDVFAIFSWVAGLFRHCTNLAERPILVLSPVLGTL